MLAVVEDRLIPRPVRHVPAAAETLAWNRAREAEWHAAPAALEALLRELAPAVFNDQPPPLAVGINATLVALLAGEFDAVAINRFLRDWCIGPRIWKPWHGVRRAATWTAAPQASLTNVPALLPPCCFAAAGVHHERHP